MAVGASSAFYDAINDALRTQFTPAPPRRVFTWWDWTWRLGVVAAHVGIAVLWVALGLWVPACIDAAAFVMFASWTRRDYKREKEKKHGRNRQAQEDSPDPGDGAGTPGTFDASDLTCDASDLTWTSAFGANTVPGAGYTRGGLVLSPSTYSFQTGTFQIQWGSSGVFSTSIDEERVDPAEVETVQGDMPILAHRAAHLWLLRGVEPFGSVSHNHNFGVEEQAECLNQTNIHEGEPAPALVCDCGFYAVPLDAEPWGNDDSVVLMVELSGTVIEHEQGYRAQHQRVVECQVPSCMYCGADPEVLVYDEDGRYCRSECAGHRSNMGACETLDRARARLGVPITVREWEADDAD